MNMTVKATALILGLLMSCAAGAAEAQTSFSGQHFTVDDSGVIECSGDCVVKFTQPGTIRGSAASGKISATSGTVLNAVSVRVVVNNMQYDVAGQAVIQKLPDGRTELRGDRIRMSRLPATL
jgi:hypothetical protein